MNFAARVLVAIGLVALALLLWELRQVALLVFGGIVFATMLGALATLVQRYTGLSYRLAVVTSVLLVVLAVGAISWLAGGAMVTQMANLSEQLPQAIAALRRWLQDQPLGSRLLQFWRAASQRIPWSEVAALGAATFNAVGLFLLMLLVGVFLAADPRLYRAGFLRLLPPAVRDRTDEAFAQAGQALRGWLKGQAISMLFVGVATAGGLALLGIPLAMTLGLIAGLLTFVPWFGPIASGLLAVLLAFTEGPQKAVYVAVLMLAIEQAQDNLLMPLVQKWAVALPPVLALVSFLVFTGLFGPAGMLFATPLMVVLMALVRKLYVQELLETGAPGGP